MKKLLFLMLCAAFAVTASANLTGTQVKKAYVPKTRTAVEQKYRAVQGVVPTVKPMMRLEPGEEIPEGYAAITLEHTGSASIHSTRKSRQRDMLRSMGKLRSIG